MVKTKKQTWKIEPISVPKNLQRSPKDSLKGSGLPELFCNIAIVGAVRSGKTTAQTFLVDKLLSSYQKCIVFSPNSKTDEKWRALGEKYPEKILFKTKLTNDVLNAVIEKQRELFENDVNDTCLVCFDDYGSDARIRGTYGAALDALATQYRWAGISMIGCYHTFKQLSAVQRAQVSHWFIFRMSDTEVKKITPELRCHLTDAEFEETLRTATLEPFSCLYVNLRSPTNDGVFHANEIA